MISESLTLDPTQRPLSASEGTLNRVVLTRALVRDNRLVNIRIIGDDRPGLLALVSKVIGDAGANIVEVTHNRIALDVPAKGAEFDILMETRDAQHTHDVIEALSQAGYPPRTN